MYCRKCGNKISDEDLFCSNCGMRVKFKKKEPLIDFKNLSDKYKKQLVGLSVLLIVIVVYSFLNNYFFCETAVIRRYTKAYANKDYNEVIELSGITKNEFITLKNINKKYGSNSLNAVDIEVLTTNYTKGEHTRTVKYTVNGSTVTLNLTVKKSGRKFLIFNNYIITSTSLTANNVEFVIPKEATLNIDGVDLTNKYEKSSTSNTTTYKIDSLLKKDVVITLKLKNGVILTDTRSIFNNEVVNYKNLNYSNVDDASSKKIKGLIKESVTNITSNALDGKAFNDITLDKLYSDNLKKSTLFSDSYNTLLEKYSSKEISDFKISDVNIDNVSVDKNDKLSIKATIKYNYQDTKEHEKSRVVNIILDDNLLIDEFYLSTLSYMF